MPPTRRMSHQEPLMQAEKQRQTYPGGNGAGIVIVGGGAYLASAYITIRHLRSHDCKLPIQLWHLGADEVPSFWPLLSERLAVRCVDAFQVPGARDFARLGGWECKIHAIVSCPFEKVLLIDADNVPLLDPSFILESDPFLNYGQIFWPDFYYKPDHRYAIRQRAWRELGLEPASGLELESGQIAINRRVCWDQLQVTRDLNLR